MTKFKKKCICYTFMWFGVSTVALAVAGAAAYDAVFLNVNTDSNVQPNTTNAETSSSGIDVHSESDEFSDFSIQIDAYNQAINYTYDFNNSVMNYTKIVAHQYAGDASYSNSHSRFEAIKDEKGCDKIVFRAARTKIIDNFPNFSNARVTYWKDSNVSDAQPGFDYGFTSDNGQVSGIYKREYDRCYYYLDSVIDYHNSENRAIEGIVRIRVPNYSVKGWWTKRTPITLRDTNHNSNATVFYGSKWAKEPSYYTKEKKNGVLETYWQSDQFTFGVYDGRFWTLNAQPGDISISLKDSFDRFDGSVYDFVSNLNANNLHNYIDVTAFNLPRLCIGKSSADTRIRFSIDEENECLVLTLTTPRSFVPSGNLTSRNFDGVVSDMQWIKKSQLTATLSIPLSKFAPKQNVTLPIEEIAAENMRIFDEDGNMIFGENTYSIDIVESDNLLNTIVDFINENRNLFFINAPSDTEMVGRTVIEPHSMNASFTEGSDGRAVTLNFRYLQRTPYQNAPAIYKDGSFTITNLNGTPTTSNNEVDISDFRTNSYADEITISNQEFINYLRQESTIRNIFKNYPERFVDYNKRFLQLKAIESADTNSGTIVVTLLAKRYAMKEDGTFGDIEVTVTLYGLPSPLPPEPEAPGLKKTTYNISELNISGLRNNLYTVDVLNDSSMLSRIEEVLLTRPQLFLKNALTSVPENVPHFQGFEFLDTGEEIILNTSYLHSYRDETPRYNNTRIRFTGFNINNTTLKTNYRETSSNGLVVSNVGDITAYDALKSASRRQRVEQAIKDNIGNMFDNKPRQFVEAFQNNFTLNERNTKFINGSSQMIVTIECEFSYFEKAYVTKQFKIKVSGFKVQPETNTQTVFSYEVDNVNDTFDRLKEQLIDWLQKHPLQPNTSPYYFPDVNDDNLINEADFEIKHSIKGPVLKPRMVFNEDGVLNENDGSKWMYTNAVERGTLPVGGGNPVVPNSANNKLNLALLFWLSMGTIISLVVVGCVIYLVHKRLIKQNELDE